MNMYDIANNIAPGVFRAYDIRGIVDEGMNESLVYFVGRAFATAARAVDELQVVVGYDARESSEPYQKAMCQGLRDGGMDVINIGVVPTPVLYFATHHTSARSGVMITGSHNPSNYNGIKMVLAGKTINTDAIQSLYKRIVDEDFSHGKGSYSQETVVDAYIDTIVDRIHLERPLKVVVDCGNGVGAITASRLYKALGCEVVELFCEVDGRFPNHHPDPTVVENLQTLIETVKQEKADIGLAFDGDADRLGVVTDRGDIIWPDRYLMLLAQDVLSRNPGASIPFDVKCSSNLARVIEEAGGMPVMWKTGHSILKAKMFDLDAPMAGELSGHVFFQENWFGFDDGVYVGARLLDILAKRPDPASAVFAALPDNVNTPELKVPVGEDDKFDVVTNLVNSFDYQGGIATTLDGLRVDYSDGWFLVRASNTTPCLTVRFEANTSERLEALKKSVRDALMALDSSLVIPF
jgi:phosphomannomutase / phosphoglucomutase